MYNRIENTFLVGSKTLETQPIKLQNLSLETKIGWGSLCFHCEYQLVFYLIRRKSAHFGSFTSEMQFML